MNVAIPARSLFGHVWPSVVLFIKRKSTLASALVVHTHWREVLADGVDQLHGRGALEYSPS